MRFHIRELLAVVTGIHPGKPFDKLQEIYDAIPAKNENEGLFSQAKKDYVLAQLPQLANVEDDLTPGKIATIKNSPFQGDIDRIIAEWIELQTSKHGEYLELQV